MPDIELDRLFQEEAIKIRYSACGNPITIALSDLDALCDQIVNGLEERCIAG